MPLPRLSPSKVCEGACVRLCVAPSCYVAAFQLPSRRAVEKLDPANTAVKQQRVSAMASCASETALAEHITSADITCTMTCQSHQASAKSIEAFVDKKVFTPTVLAA